jgi:hypothetical protein
MKYKLGVIDVVFKLHYFKVKISAILEHHCCHSNGGSVTFVKNLISLNFFYINNTTSSAGHTAHNEYARSQVEI